MRSTIAACAILVLLMGTVDAEQCPPGALGVSRTLVVDPNEHSRVGSMQYPETLPLNDHEVVLTFDDGPLPRYTNNYIVDIGTNVAHYREVRDKYVNTAAPPASTTIGVPQLARPGALFEVEAIAVLSPK